MQEPAHLLQTMVMGGHPTGYLGCPMCPPVPQRAPLPLCPGFPEVDYFQAAAQCVEGASFSPLQGPHQAVTAKSPEIVVLPRSNARLQLPQDAQDGPTDGTSAAGDFFLAPVSPGPVGFPLLAAQTQPQRWPWWCL